MPSWAWAFALLAFGPPATAINLRQGEDNNGGTVAFPAAEVSGAFRPAIGAVAPVPGNGLPTVVDNPAMDVPPVEPPSMQELTYPGMTTTMAPKDHLELRLIRLGVKKQATTVSTSTQLDAGLTYQDTKGVVKNVGLLWKTLGRILNCDSLDDLAYVECDYLPVYMAIKQFQNSDKMCQAAFDHKPAIKHLVTDFFGNTTTCNSILPMWTLHTDKKGLRIYMTQSECKADIKKKNFVVTCNGQINYYDDDRTTTLPPYTTPPPTTTIFTTTTTEQPTTSTTVVTTTTAYRTTSTTTMKTTTNLVQKFINKLTVDFMRALMETTTTPAPTTTTGNPFAGIGQSPFGGIAYDVFGAPATTPSPYMTSPMATTSSGWR